MAAVYFRADPFDKNLVTLALEAGVDGIIAPREQMEMVGGLARCQIMALEETPVEAIVSKADEAAILERIQKGEKIILADGWEVIPVENLLAQCDDVLAEALNADQARLACGILERGVKGVVVPARAVSQIRDIVAQCRIFQDREKLLTARITRVERVGLGHRVCLDTLSILRRGQGVLVGNSSAFTFLVHAETERNEYVASRPFRINAGGAHSYVRLPRDRTAYLSELKPGDELLIVDSCGNASIATLGRVKTEVRPMLLIEAELADDNGACHSGAIFLQNAETIRLTARDGTPLSVVSLKPGDEVQCRVDEAGRHFGMRVSEEIREV